VLTSLNYDDTAWLLPVVQSGVPPPDWWSDFLVWLGGKRIGLDGEMNMLSGKQLQEIKVRLNAHMNDHFDYARLLRWRLLPAEQRPVDPYEIATQAEVADEIIRADMNNDEAEHAYDLDPWHPLIHLALAGFEEDPVRADFHAAVFSRSAAERSQTPPTCGRVPAQAGKRRFGAGSGSPKAITPTISRRTDLVTPNHYLITGLDHINAIS
jgi:hypothetical protein